MNKDFTTICITLIITLCSIVAAYTIYSINDRNNMSKNIESAISKGVDPISVKCAYEISTNALCITYAATRR